MYDHKIILPALGMAQTTGVIVEWYKKAGEWVEVDENIMAVETDKTTMDIPTAEAGLVSRITAALGEELDVGSAVAWLRCPENEEEKKQLLSEGAQLATAEQGSEQGAGGQKATASAGEAVQKTDAAAALENEKVAVQQREDKSPSFSVEGHALRILASPKAKVLAQEKQIKLEELLAHSQWKQPFHASDVLSYSSWKAQQAQAQSSHLLVKRVKLDKLLQLQQWLGERSHWELVHLWVSLNRIVLAEQQNFANVPLRASRLKEGVLEYFEVDFSNSPSLAQLSLSAEPEGKVPLLIQTIEDEDIEDYCCLQADWQVTLFLSSSATRLSLQAQPQSYKMAQMLSYAYRLAELVAEPFPLLL